MFHYGAFTPKPHYAYGNSAVLLKLDKGKLKGWKQQAQQEGRPSQKTCETYMNSKGQKCFKGTTFLKKTEILDLDWYLFMYVCFISRKSSNDLWLILDNDFHCLF